MAQVDEVGEKLRSAIEAVEEAKRALSDLNVDELEALSEGESEDFEVAIFQIFLANLVRRMVGSHLQQPLDRLRISSARALELLREVEANVGRSVPTDSGIPVG